MKAMVLKKNYIFVDTPPGMEVGRMFEKAAITAIIEQCDIVFIHNDRKYKIDFDKLEDAIIDCTEEIK